MCHIIESCPLTKLNGGLSRLHSADKDAFLGWPIMVHNMYTRRRRNPITNGYEDFCFIFPRNNVFVSTYLLTKRVERRALLTFVSTFDQFLIDVPLSSVFQDVEETQVDSVRLFQDDVQQRLGGFN